jgi:hypothetical protein
VYYVPVVLQDAGVTKLKMQLLGCLMVGVFKTMFVMVGQFNLDSYGRRPVMLWSISLVTIALSMLATNFTIHDPPSWLAIASLCTFVSAFSIGEGPVTWVLVSEVRDRSADTTPRLANAVDSPYASRHRSFRLSMLMHTQVRGGAVWHVGRQIFPMSIRSKGTSLAMGLNRMMSGAIATLFLSMNQVLTAAGTFWLFSTISLCHLYFTYITVPETKGKTLEQIEAYLVKFASIPLQVINVALCAPHVKGDRVAPRAMHATVTYTPGFLQEENRVGCPTSVGRHQLPKGSSTYFPKAKRILWGLGLATQSDEPTADDEVGGISPTAAGPGRSSYETFVDDCSPLLQGSNHQPGANPASMSTGREPLPVKNRGGKLSV